MALGAGGKFCYYSAKKHGDGVKNCPELRDVICGRPIFWHLIMCPRSLMSGKRYFGQTNDRIFCIFWQKIKLFCYYFLTFLGNENAWAFHNFVARGVLSWSQWQWCCSCRRPDFSSLSTMLSASSRLAKLFHLCQSFRLANRDDYFRVSYDHFRKEHHFLRQLGQLKKIRSSLKPKKQKQNLS